MNLQGYDHKLIDLIPPDAGLVVEIGCGGGQLGAGYKRRNPAGTYIGLEPDTRLAAQAGTLLDRVINGMDYPRLLEESDQGAVDCLVVHLDSRLFVNLMADQLVCDLSRSLSEHAVLLLGIVNQRYGQWLRDYLEDEGISCNEVLTGMENPLQLSADEIKAVIHQAGLKLVDIFQVEERSPEYRQFLQTIKGNAALQDSRQSLLIPAIKQPYFIVRAEKKSPDRSMVIQSMTLQPVAACNDKRIHEPELFLGTIPGVVTHTSVNTVEIELTPGERRVLVWQRPIMTRPESLHKLRELLRAGYLIIVEFDDDPRRWPAIVENDFLSFRGVHGVQTSTVELADLLRQFNPNVEVFPNQIMQLPETKPVPDDGTVRIFFGALNREADWQPLMPALNRVLKKFSRELRVNVVHDRAFYNQLDTPMKSFQPLCDYDRYLQILGECDISLLPLEPTKFNRYKSDLKFIENAVFGVVSLASPVVYGNTIEEGVTGVLFRNVQEFEDKLGHLITDPDFRGRITEQAFHWTVNHRMLNRHYRKRYEWYLQMLDRLPELNKELQLRLPELFEKNN